MKKISGKLRVLYTAGLVSFFIFFGGFAMYLNQPVFGVRYCLDENRFMYDREMIDQVKPIFMREIVKENETRPVAEVTETVDILFDALKECFDQNTAYECLAVHSYPLHNYIKYPRTHQVALEKLNGKKSIVWGNFDLDDIVKTTFIIGVDNADKDWLYTIVMANPGCGFHERIERSSGVF